MFVHVGLMRMLQGFIAPAVSSFPCGQRMIETICAQRSLNGWIGSSLVLCNLPAGAPPLAPQGGFHQASLQPSPCAATYQDALEILQVLRHRLWVLSSGIPIFRGLAWGQRTLKLADSKHFSTRNVELIAVSAIMIFLSILFTTWRVLVRFKVSFWMGWSDWLMIIGAVCIMERRTILD
jgi:hypothetical protein